MTDNELDVLDELHFVQSFSYLQGTLGLPDKTLKETLRELAEKGWVKILRTADDEVTLPEADLTTNGQHYFYLATKKGLLAYHTK